MTVEEDIKYRLGLLAIRYTHDIGLSEAHLNLNAASEDKFFERVRSLIHEYDRAIDEGTANQEWRGDY